MSPRRWQVWGGRSGCAGEGKGRCVVTAGRASAGTGSGAAQYRHRGSGRPPALAWLVTQGHGGEGWRDMVLTGAAGGAPGLYIPGQQDPGKASVPAQSRHPPRANQHYPQLPPPGVQEGWLLGHGEVLSQALRLCEKALCPFAGRYSRAVHGTGRAGGWGRG